MLLTNTVPIQIALLHNNRHCFLEQGWNNFSFLFSLQDRMFLSRFATDGSADAGDCGDDHADDDGGDVDDADADADADDDD